MSPAFYVRYGKKKKWSNQNQYVLLIDEDICHIPFNTDYIQATTLP